MTKGANFEVIDDQPEYLLIRDLGPWDIFPTITNDAEKVVAKLADRLGTRKLYYIDSEGNKDEIRVQHGRFMGFYPWSSEQ